MLQRRRDKGTRRQGDKGTGRRGEKETRRQGDKKTRCFSPCLLVSLSPCPLVSLSPLLPGSVALWLCGWSDRFVRETGDIFGARDVSFRPRRLAARTPLCGLVQGDHRPEGRRGLATDRMRRADRRLG